MPEYLLDKEYLLQIFEKEALNFKEFECCTFTNCDFSLCHFIAVTFIECTFNNCTFSGAQINHVAFRTVIFNLCEIKEVNFSMCDKLIFEVVFNKCILDFSKFYALNLQGTPFTNCSLVAVDFMETDLSKVIFDNCDLYRTEFSKAKANKCNFKTSYNFTIDPKKTTLKKAIFSKKELKGLLFTHDIHVVE
jgi:uncharacterized protein YjbI with pentapeptide repeats